MLTEQKKTALEHFATGRRFYKMMNFLQARAEFATALVAEPDDGPSRLYLERCDYYIQNPPPEDWDGVFTMTTK